MDEERFVVTARNSAGKRQSKKINETAQGLWVGNQKVGSQVVNKV